MKDITTILKESNWTTTAIVIMPIRPPMYWLNLPMYADLYIRPAYELINDFEGLCEFIIYFLGEWEASDNPAKRTAIEAIVFPLYYKITGRNFDSKLVAL